MNDCLEIFDFESLQSGETLKKSKKRRLSEEAFSAI